MDTTGALWIKTSGTGNSGWTAAGTSGAVAFGTIAVSGQTNVVAGTSSDTLTLAAGTNMTITTTPASKTVTFASTAGGGNVSNSGTPTLNQMAQWTDATHIQGVTTVPIAQGGTGAATVAANTVFGNNTGSTAAPGFQTLTDSQVPDVLTLTRASNLTTNGIVTASSANGTLGSGSLTGDVTTSGAGLATTLTNSAVTYAKIQNVGAESVLTRAASTSGIVGETALAASQLLGRGPSGDLGAISLGTNLSITAGTLNATGGGAPGGTTGQIQYNNGGVFGGFNGDTGATNNFLTGISSSGVTKAQPAFSNLSGNIATSQMNSGTGASALTLWYGDGTWRLPSWGGSTTGHGDSTYQILSTDRIVYSTATLTQNRTWNLPAASAVPAGTAIMVIDLFGGVATTNRIKVQVKNPPLTDLVFPANSDSYFISTPYGGATFTSDGTSNWYVSSVQPGGDALGLFPQQNNTAGSWAASLYGLPTAVGTSNYVMTSDGTNAVWTLNTGTNDVVRRTSPTIDGATINAPWIKQTTNGNALIYGTRVTNTSPAGWLIQLQDATPTTNLFAVDITGKLTAGTIPDTNISWTNPGSNTVRVFDIAEAGGGAPVNATMGSGLVYTHSTHTLDAPSTGGIASTSAALAGNGSGNAVAASSSTTATFGTINVGNVSDTAVVRSSAGHISVAGSIVGLASNDLSFFTTSTSNAIGVGTIELGNASDTTIARSSGGHISVEGSIVGLASNDLSFFTTSTSNTIGVGNIELGNASDTTVARASAGHVSVEGNNLEFDANPNSAASATTSWTPNFDAYDMEVLTALAGAITVNAPTWTGTKNGAKRILRIKDNGVARGLTWTTGSTGAFRASGDLPLPPTTTAGKTIYMRFYWNNDDSRWDFMAKLDNF